MPFRTLISTDALAGYLTDPLLVIVDCRFKLGDVDWGEREYLARHIPGAAYAHMERDLSGTKTGANGRHPLPDPAEAARTFGRLGIDSSTQVVAYDQDNGMFAARLWWTLRWLGHDQVAVLDGGFAKWAAENRPVASGAEGRPARAFSAVGQPSMAVGPDEVAANIGRGDRRLIDARSPERYRGENETLDKTAGHIPGASNHFFQWNLDGQGTFRTREELRARFEDTLGGVPPGRVVCYCGSGVTACHNLLAMEHAGLSGARLYPGSWSEWSSDPARPIERDPE